MSPSPQSDESHFLDRDFHPDPQVLVQELHELQDPHCSLHCCVLQSIISVASPEQYSPPSAGRGESQFLDLFFIPPPQDLVQEVHDFHGPQLPSTWMEKSLKLNIHYLAYCSYDKNNSGKPTGGINSKKERNDPFVERFT